MRVTRWIPLGNIDVDNHSISPETYDLALKLDCGEVDIETLKPLKVVLDTSTGRFKIHDGRHRFTAFKLLGLPKIRCRYYKKD